MKIKFFVILLCTVLFFSCKKQQLPLSSPNNRELAKSESELLSVVNDMLQMNNDNNPAKKITQIDHYEAANRLLSIVTYITDKGEEANIGIEKQFDELGKLTAELGFKCKGTCSCRIGAVLNPDGSLNYAECTCSPCSMTVTVYPKAVNSAKKPGIDIQALANKSYAETFNSFENVRIVDLRYDDNEVATIQHYTYENSKGQQSTFMILKVKTDFTANGTTLSKEKSYEVDCTGTCDCRERFIPANNSIECTCSPCKMKITEITPAP
jgi:hypothetical protein